MVKAKGDRVLKRNKFSAVWEHKKVQPADGHVADEHESGAKWLCYDCGEEVILGEGYGMYLQPVEQPER